jgi:hypothetical protein
MMGQLQVEPAGMVRLRCHEFFHSQTPACHDLKTTAQSKNKQASTSQ